MPVGELSIVCRAQDLPLKDSCKNVPLIRIQLHRDFCATEDFWCNDITNAIIYYYLFACKIVDMPKQLLGNVCSHHSLELSFRTWFVAPA